VTSFRSSSQVFTVQAGSEVTGAWLHTLTSKSEANQSRQTTDARGSHDTLGTGPDSTADNKVIDSSHKVRRGRS
jgi:cellulase